MLHSFKIPAIVILSFGLTIYLPSCKKDTEESILPAVLTLKTNEITQTTASFDVVIMSYGGAPASEEGFCWNTSGNPTITDKKISEGTSKGKYTSRLTGLEPNTIYYVRAYAINSAGIGFSNQVSITTSKYPVVIINIPTVITIPVSKIQVGSAMSGIILAASGFDIITEMGICWATIPNPTTSDFKSTIEGLIGNSFLIQMNTLHPSTTYYVRAFATNSAGTGYGDELSFTTLSVSPVVFNTNITYGTVSDVDGNSYKTIQIGAQFWMAENLKTKKYNDGTSIPNVTDKTEWDNLSTPGYSWYNNDEAGYKSTYGALYNWYAVKTDKLCPSGWHAPSNDEWNTMITYLGGEIAAGLKVTETGSTHWLQTIAGATNETGFTGLPGGFRSIGKDFQGFSALGYYGIWWTTTDYTPPYDALVTQLPSYDYSDTGNWGLESGYAAKKVAGASVRCVKD